MARNSEKRLSGLNRFLEAKEAEKNTKLQRPPLSRLESADEVKGWIPSIEKEISYLLKQIEGKGSRRHNDAKVAEFQERIDFLKREHQRFVAKVRSLDPSYRDVVPWQPRGYTRKRGRELRVMGGDGGEGEVREGGPPEAKRLVSPLLDRLEEKQERPTQPARIPVAESHMYAASLQGLCGGCSQFTKSNTREKGDDNGTEDAGRAEETESERVRDSLATTGGLLGLNYSSSGDESEEEN